MERKSPRKERVADGSNRQTTTDFGVEQGLEVEAVESHCSVSGRFDAAERRGGTAPVTRASVLGGTGCFEGETFGGYGTNGNDGKHRTQYHSCTNTNCMCAQNPESSSEGEEAGVLPVPTRSPRAKRLRRPRAKQAGGGKRRRQLERSTATRLKSKATRGSSSERLVEVRHLRRNDEAAPAKASA